MSTAPTSMSAPRRNVGSEPRRRRRPVQEVEEETSSEEESDDSEESSGEEDDSEEEEQQQQKQQKQRRAPPTSSRPPHIARSSSSNIANTSTKRRPPPKPLNTSRSANSVPRQDQQQQEPQPKPQPQQQQKPRTVARPSNTTSGGGGGGSSVPSYEDSASPGAGDAYSHYSHLPTPPTSGLRPPHRPGWNSPLSPPLPPPSVRSSPRPRRPRTHTLPPALEHAATDDSYASSSSFATTSSSSSAGRPTAPGGPSSSAASSAKKGKTPVPLKRNKTVREPATAPVQAVVPRVPRNVAAAKMHHIDEEYDDGEDDDGVEDVDDILWRSGTGTGAVVQDHVAPPRKQVAGGKKASLAVELKMNLEIELELKAYIHGDVTLELFN